MNHDSDHYEKKSSRSASFDRWAGMVLLVIVAALTAAMLWALWVTRK